jgi:hypothetical protein
MSVGACTTRGLTILWAACRNSSISAAEECVAISPSACPSNAFLLPGSYEVAFTCDGEILEPEAGKPAEIVAQEVTTADF